MEVGGDVLDADHATMASVPGGVVTATVGHPEYGGLDDVRIPETEPKVALFRETDRAPSWLIPRAGSDHDKIFESIPSRIAGDIRGLSRGQGNGTQVLELGALFERGVSADGGIFKLIGENLSGGVGTQTNDSGGTVGTLDHGMVT